MAQALPAHIIDEIERRWERGSTGEPQMNRGKNDDRSVRQCPRCDFSMPFGPTTSGGAGAFGGHICSRCGHSWGSGIP